LSLPHPLRTSRARLALLGAITSCVSACSSHDAPDLHNSSAGTSGQAGAASSDGGSGTAGSGVAGNSTASGGGGSAGAANDTAGKSSVGGAAGSGATGGSGGEAGTASAGAGGMAGAANGACPANAQLCLDFEDGAFAGWNKKESGGTITVDGTHFSNGSKALLISVPAGKAGGMIENHGSPLFPLPDKQLWGRMMVYFEGVPDGHTDLARGNGGNGGPNYNVGEQHASIMLNYYAGSAATDCWARPKPEKKVPDKTWMCWEWRFDSAKNQMDFWMDGTLLRSVDKNGDGCLTGNGVWQAPPSFESISVGQQIAEISNNTAYKTWIDDVAISNSARVGCPPAQ
jgi:hypothetical protein